MDLSTYHRDCYSSEPTGCCLSVTHSSSFQSNLRWLHFCKIILGAFVLLHQRSGDYLWLPASLSQILFNWPSPSRFEVCLFSLVYWCPLTLVHLASWPLRARWSSSWLIGGWQRFYLGIQRTFAYVSGRRAAWWYPVLWAVLSHPCLEEGRWDCLGLHYTCPGLLVLVCLRLFWKLGRGGSLRGKRA